jgi:hypothetical protein
MKSAFGYSAEKGDECFIAQVVEWSDWGERHGRLSREGSGRALREAAERQLVWNRWNGQDERVSV